MTDEAIKEILNTLQMQSQQLQVLMMQKQALLIQTKEIEKALEELDTNPEEVFKSVGPILIKTTTKNLKKELTDTKEDVDLKISTMEAQEKRLTEKMKQNQEKIQGLSHPGHGG